MDGDMEARVKRLEEDFRELRSDVKATRLDIAEIKGRIAAMPTTIQLAGFVVAIYVASGMLRYFGH